MDKSAPVVIYKMEMSRTIMRGRNANQNRSRRVQTFTSEKLAWEAFRNEHLPVGHRLTLMKVVLPEVIAARESPSTVTPIQPLPRK